LSGRLTTSRGSLATKKRELQMTLGLAR
jgi:hypothetical protein